jgi:hypothetical protein
MRHTGFEGFAEAEATGLCYPWAYKYVMKHPDAILVQGTTVVPFEKPVRKIKHAWVEHRGKAMDWQTMKAGYGGHWRGKGYPLAKFYEIYKPTNMRRYTQKEANEALLSSRGGVETGGPHFGPWHGPGSRGGRRKRS